jgi:hypothetical protein
MRLKNGNNGELSRVGLGGIDADSTYVHTSAGAESDQEFMASQRQDRWESGEKVRMLTRTPGCASRLRPNLGFSVPIMCSLLTTKGMYIG